MSSGDTGGRRTLDAVGKTLDLVEALWRLDGAGITELTEETDLPKSTVHVHLATLKDKGYVVQDEGEYRLSLRFMTYGEHVKRSEELYRTARDPVENLAERTGERVFCSTCQNGLATVLCLGSGERSLSSDITVGTQTYMHASAGGKAMMAYMPESRVHEIIDEWGLPSFTEETITTREELFGALETVRDRGVAINTGEYRAGVETVAAPILGPGDQVHGSVALAGPVRRLRSELGEDELKAQLLATANTIEVNMSID